MLLGNPRRDQTNLRSLLVVPFEHVMPKFEKLGKEFAAWRTGESSSCKSRDARIYRLDGLVVNKTWLRFAIR